MIRKYEPDDLEELLSTWDAASAVAHPFLSDEFQAASRDQIANVFLPITETWVWETGGRVVGFISLLDNELGGLFVDPRFHRKGIGRALVDHVRESRKELEVEVFKANEIGRQFYERYGFVLTEEKTHGDTGQDVLRLRLALENPTVAE